MNAFSLKWNNDNLVQAVWKKIWRNKGIYISGQQGDEKACRALRRQGDRLEIIYQNRGMKDALSRG